MVGHTISLSQKIAAIGVHLLTAFGVVLGFAALNAVIDGNDRLMWLLLGGAFLIDGIDGPLSRQVNITQRLPEYDGAVLDLLVDYLTYVLVPVFYLYRLDFLPSPLAPWFAASILMASLYTFGNRNMKSQDHYFVGFPAVWNVVAFYFFAYHTSVWLNAIVVLFLVVLTFTRIKMVHPFRVRAWRPATLAFVFLWSAGALTIILAPERVYDGALWVIGLTSFYFLGISLWRTWAGPDGQA